MKKIIMSLLLSSGILFAGEPKIIVNDFSKENKYSENSLKSIEITRKLSETTLTKEQVDTITEKIKAVLKTEGFENYEISILNEVYKTTSEGVAKCKDVICMGKIFDQFKDFIIIDVVVKYDVEKKQNLIIPFVINFAEINKFQSKFIYIQDDKNIDYKKINGQIFKLLFGENYQMKPEWVTKKEGLYVVKGKKVLRMIGISSDLGDEQMTIMSSGDDARVKLAQFANSIITYEKKNGTEVSEVKAKIKFSGAQIIEVWTAKTNTVYTLLEVDVESLKKSNPDIPASFFDNLKVIETIE